MSSRKERNGTSQRTKERKIKDGEVKEEEDEEARRERRRAGDKRTREE